MRIEKNEWIAQSFVAFSVLNQKENNNGNLVLCQHLTNCVSRFFFELYKTYLIYFCKQLCCNLGKGDNETLLPTQINSQTGNFQWCFPLSAVLPFNETGFAIWLCFGWWKSSNMCVWLCVPTKKIFAGILTFTFLPQVDDRDHCSYPDQKFKCIFGRF